MPDLTVLTPIHLNHQALFDACAASVAAQTVPILHLAKWDVGSGGAGAVRNELLKQVQTRYVTFLDADDWLEPTFAEETLAFLQAHRNRYCYTDWFQDGRPIEAPDCPWIRRTFHLVTAVVPTAWAREVGGFDESLPGMEDTDFYLKLVTRRMPGCRLAVPLVNYRANGGRARAIHESGEAERLQEEMTRRYGELKVGCCGDSSEPDLTPIGTQRPGDVLAMALWGGNRSVMGLATGRHYPRTGNGKREWVDPRDVRAAPQQWALVPDSEPEPPPMPEIARPKAKGLAALHAQMLDRGLVREPVMSSATPVAAARPLPNVRKVRRLAGALILPVFVAPRRSYPSYTDFWRLVDLGGFAIRPADEIDLNDPGQTYIFVSPEGIPDCTGAAARTIFWQFEYVGDYTEQENRHTCDEVWSSDPAHAEDHGYRYVICGSHPGLNPIGERGTIQYDLCALMYLTERRRALRTHLLLADYRWAPDYPGHEGQARHEALSTSRLMLVCHQHEDPALAPLRLALAAAYHLPVIAEGVNRTGIYTQAVLWANYDHLPEMADMYLQGKLEAQHLPEALYQLLCVEHRFDQEVMRAVEAKELDPA